MFVKEYPGGSVGVSAMEVQFVSLIPSHFPLFTVK